MNIINGEIFTEEGYFSKQSIVITGEKISSIQPDNQNTISNEDCLTYDATGCYVVPGFTDVHFHGCANEDFSNCNQEGLFQIGAYELKSGITQICPATMTYPEEILFDILENAKNYYSHKCSDNFPVSDLVGVHLEGPFISPKKKGAQNEKFISLPDIDFIKCLQKTAPGLIKLITMAPELAGSLDFIKKMSKEINISLGHSESDYVTATKAFQAGANHVTHLYNAMSSFSHRDTGIVGAAFDDKDAFIELICDGVHISDSMIRACFQLFGDDRMILISDSIMATGMPDGTYSLGGQTVLVKENRATLLDDTIAGSVTNLFDCFKYAVSIGISLESALKAVTINPAKSIQIDKDYGSITSGKYANLLILNKNLEIRDIIFHGKLVLR